MRVLTHFVRWALSLSAPETQTTEAERECLARHAMGRARLVEIGVWHGVTSKVLRAAMSEDATLIAVDPFPPGRLGVSLPRMIARRELARVQRGRVEWMRTTGVAAAAAHAAAGRPPVDFLFIDGDHTYEGIRGDWNGWSGQVAPGGIVALHDSRATPDRPIADTGSVRFTRKVVALDERFELVEEVDSLSVLRRRAVPPPGEAVC